MKNVIRHKEVWTKQNPNDKRIYDDLDWSYLGYEFKKECRCDRCNQPINHVFTIEEKEGVIMNVGVDCFGELTHSDNLLVEVMKEYSQKRWSDRKFKCGGDYQGRAIKEYKFSHNKLRITKESRGWIMTIGFKEKGKRNFYNWSNESRTIPKGLSNDVYKELLWNYYIYVRTHNENIIDFARKNTGNILNELASIKPSSGLHEQN